MNNFKGKHLSDYAEVHHEMINIMSVLPPESRYDILMYISKIAEENGVFAEKDLCELERNVYKTKKTNYEQ